MGIMEHLNTPGSSMKLLPLIQIITTFLMSLCCVGIYYNVASVHMYIMLFLGAGLLGSVSFVVVEFQRLKGIDAKAAAAGAANNIEPQPQDNSDKKTD